MDANPENDASSLEKWAVSYGQIMQPQQKDNDYKLGEKTVHAPDNFIISQLLTIINNLISEIYYLGDCELTYYHDAVKTLYQTRQSFNLIQQSQALKHQKIPEDQTVEQVADPLATLLATRDSNLSAAKQYIEVVNTLAPGQFFDAMRLIACNKVQVRDENGSPILDDENKPLSSSCLYHPSFFFDGDLIFFSQLLSENKHSDEFLLFWVRRKLTALLNLISPITEEEMTSLFNGVTTLKQAVKKILNSDAGITLETHLRMVYYQQLVYLVLLTNPHIKMPLFGEMLNDLKIKADNIWGIPELINALIPETKQIPKLDHNVAEMLTLALIHKKKSRLFVTINCLTEAVQPSQIIALLYNEISRKRKRFHAVNDYSASVSNDQLSNESDSSILASILKDYKPTHRGNPKLLNNIHTKIGYLITTKQLQKLVFFINEIREQDLETKNTRKLIRHLIERQYANKEITHDDLKYIFREIGLERSIGIDNPASHVQKILRPPDSLQLRRCLRPRERSYTAKIVKTAFINIKETAYPIERGASAGQSHQIHHDQTEVPPLWASAATVFQSLPSRLNTAHHPAVTECCICYNEPTLLYNPHNAHPNILICQPCINQIMKSNKECPGCRTPMVKANFTRYPQLSALISELPDHCPSLLLMMTKSDVCYTNSIF